LDFNCPLNQPIYYCLYSLPGGPVFARVFWFVVFTLEEAYPPVLFVLGIHSECTLKTFNDFEVIFTAWESKGQMHASV